MADTMDAVIYPVADALGMVMHVMDDGRIRGAEMREVKVGPWKFNAEVTVVSDIADITQTALLVKVVGHLWFYVVSRFQVQLAIYVVDGNILKLHVKDAATFGGKSIEDTLGKLMPGLITAYQFDESTKQWVEDANNLEHLDNMSKPKNAIVPFTGSTAVQ